MKQKLGLKILIVGIVSIFSMFTFLFLVQNITNNQSSSFNLASVNGGVQPTVLKDENKQTYYINGKIASRPATSNAIVKQQLNNLKSVVTLGNTETNLQLVNEQTINKSRVYRFSQKYNGLPVYGKQVIAVSNENNYINQVVLDVSENLKLSTTPKYNAHEITAEILNLPQYANAYVANTNLIVYSLYNYVPTLAYAVTIETENENLLKYSDLIVNANTKEIIVNIPLISASIASTQTDGFGKPREVEITYDDKTGKYYLADETRNIFVYDAKNASNGSASLVGSSSQTFSDPYAVSLFANLKECYDFYKNKNNVGVSLNGPDNKGMEVVGIIHYGTNYENAAWVTGDGLPTDNDPNLNEGYIVVGDGGYTFKNLSLGLDVLGHEYQHAVTTYTAGLIYFNASGALDEGFSNLFGALIENKTGQDFWTIGEDIMKTASCLYDLSNPHNSLTPAPMSLSDPKFKPFCYENHSHDHCDYGGVHSNSSILTYAAYKMAQENPTFFTNEKLGELFYNSLILLPSTATFNHARVACVTAAASLGYGSDVINTIKQSFTSVGVMGEDAAVSIVYDGNGATKGTVPENTVGKYDSPITISNNINGLEKDKHAFYCWNTKPDGTGADYFAGNTIAITDNTTLYAKWVRGLWAGETTRSFSSGEGTEQNPYIISTTGELAYLAFAVNNNLQDNTNGMYYKNNHYKLVNNLDVSKESWVPIGNTNNEFGGTFNGDGHKITLLIQNNEFVNSGLFGNINNAKIFNVGIYGKARGNKSYIGSIASVAKNSQITNCYSSLHVGDSLSFGGIVGSLENSTIANCYFAGTSKSGISVGGIVSVLKKSNIYNSYNIGDLFATSLIGGIVAQVHEGKVVNCFNVGSLNNAFYMGGIVSIISNNANNNIVISNCVNYGKINFEEGAFNYVGGIVGNNNNITITLENNIFKSYTGLKACGVKDISEEQQGKVGNSSNDDYLTGKFDFDEINFYESFLNNEGNGTTKFNFLNVWTFNSNIAITQPSYGLPVLNFAPNWESVKSEMLSGQGTSQNPYLIQSENDLAFLSYAVNNQLKNANNTSYASCDYKLTKNLDLQGAYFNPIGAYYPFKGTFAGNVHTISNLQINSGSNFSLFGNVVGGNIEDLGIRDVNLVAYGTEIVSGVANVIENSYLYRVYVAGTLIGETASGIVNTSINGHISNVYANAYIYGTQDAAGINNTFKSGSILNAYVDGKLFGEGNIGGVVGEVCTDTEPAKIENILQASTITNKSYFGKNVIGGIVGVLKLTTSNIVIDSAVNIGEVKNAENSITGGVVGKVVSRSNLLTIKNCRTNRSDLVGEVETTVSSPNITNNWENQDLRKKDVMSNIFSSDYWKYGAWDEYIWEVRNNYLVFSEYDDCYNIIFSKKNNIIFTDAYGNKMNDGSSEKYRLYNFKVKSSPSVNVYCNGNLIHPNAENVYSFYVTGNMLIEASQKHKVTYNVKKEYVVPLLSEDNYNANLFYFSIKRIGGFNYDNLLVYANNKLITEINNNVYVADYSNEDVEITVKGVHSNIKHYVTLESAITEQLVQLLNYNGFVYAGLDLLLNVEKLDKYDYENMLVYGNNVLAVREGDNYIFEDVQSDISIKIVGIVDKTFRIYLNTPSEKFVNLTSNAVVYGSEITFTINELDNYDYENLQVLVNGELLLPNEAGVYTVSNITKILNIEVLGVEPITNNWAIYSLIICACVCVLAFIVFLLIKKKRKNKIN